MSSDGIHFIQFEYDKMGHAVWSNRHGGNSGSRTDQIKLDYPTQFLVSISGYCDSIADNGPVIIRSLCLETNRKIYGPFGVEKGVPFSMSSVNAEMLVGFHGWSNKYLNAIGVYVKPTPLLQTKLLETQKIIPTTQVANKKILSLGPWGGDGGTTFDDGIYTGVREVYITRTGGLVSIRVCYDLNGKPVWGNKNGGTGGLKLDKIVFDYPYEVLTHIEGYYSSTILRGPTIIKSITFRTNRSSYGPFGDQQGISFTSGTVDGAIIGFHGRNGYFVHSLGVHVLERKTFLPRLYPYDLSRPSLIPEVVLGVPRPQDDLYDPQIYKDPLLISIPKASEAPFGAPRQPDFNNRRPNSIPLPVASPRASEVALGMPRQPGLNQSGPWGGEGGTAWDDGVYTGVKQIVITRGDAICSIQVQYDQNGKSVWSAPRGRTNDVCSYHIKFDYPYEVLTSISGYYGLLVGDIQKRVIVSLTFYTSRAKYGPYGKQMGNSFSSANKEGKIVGFHGRSTGTFLNAIGVHMQPFVNEVSSRHSYSHERGGFKTLPHKNNNI
ncbi:jacalin-related lectin 3-like isoform X3 [Amaranthus tricolor]|nr:jacalin-related lectin 3-like isoform X3 [Amaranthus tricolor]